MTIPDLLNPTAEHQPERKSASHVEAGYERAEPAKAVGDLL